MAEEQERKEMEFQSVPRWLLVAVGVLAVVSLVAISMAFKASDRANNAEQTLAAEIRTVRQSSQQNVELLSKRLERAEAVNAQAQGELSVVTKRLKLTREELKQAREEALQIREENAKQLAAMDTAVKSELVTKASADEVKAVGHDVAGVRTDLDTTKKDLQMARSELGTLIARNHDEIEQLRKLGERDYLEFTVNGKGNRQRLGPITIELRATKPGKNLYSVALYVEDKRLDKKNRSANEPIFFYIRGTRQPLELVVNQVEKDKVAGYLSVPKSSTGTSGS
jgi:hypothetical protein